MNIYTRISNGYSEETIINATREEVKRVQRMMERELKLVEQMVNV